ALGGKISWSSELFGTSLVLKNWTGLSVSWSCQLPGPFQAALTAPVHLKTERTSRLSSASSCGRAEALRRGRPGRALRDRAFVTCCHQLRNIGILLSQRESVGTHPGRGGARDLLRPGGPCPLGADRDRGRYGDKKRESVGPRPGRGRGGDGSSVERV